ncbi:hypothetical protein LZ31DRAFT_131944 [Colletotrichum somersetense]|nr:hypothetical protein LZ31DRAFT_131944 [Colletotrichum somersetense]
MLKRRGSLREVENISRVDRGPPLTTWTPKAHLVTTETKCLPGKDDFGREIFLVANYNTSIKIMKECVLVEDGFEAASRKHRLPRTAVFPVVRRKFTLSEVPSISATGRNRAHDSDDQKQGGRLAQMCLCWYLLHDSPARRHRRIGHCATALLDKIAVSCYCPGSGRGPGSTSPMTSAETSTWPWLWTGMPVFVRAPDLSQYHREEKRWTARRRMDTWGGATT